HLRPWFESLPAADQDATSPHADFKPMQNGTVFPYLEHYIPYLYPQPVSLLDYAPDNALIVVEDWSELRDTIAGIEESALKNRAEKLAANLLPPDYPLPYLTWDALAEELAHRTTVHLGQVASLAEPDSVQPLFTPGQLFGGQLRLMLDSLHKLRADDQSRIVVVT